MSGFAGPLTGQSSHGAVGLREEEVAQAAQIMTSGIACLALFPGAATNTDRGNVYELFAEVFIVLQASATSWADVTLKKCLTIDTGNSLPCTALQARAVLALQCALTRCVQRCVLLPQI